MTKLKQLYLKNYCGYRETTFDFTRDDGSLKNIAVFCGSNGCGKSTLLDAINIIASASRYVTKDTSKLFRKITFHPDYDPTYAGFQTSSDPMQIIGIFSCSGEDKTVIIETDKVVRNDLSPKHNSYSYLINADKESERRKFQLHSEMKDTFLELANTIYGYKVFMAQENVDLYGSGESFYTNFIIEKENGVKVHFKRMSDGESKIAKLISSLCNPLYMNGTDIITIDNIVMHIYKNRHAKTVKKILEMFPEKQFFITTHSPILVGVDDDENDIHIKPFIERENIYDIEKYRVEESERIGKIDTKSSYLIEADTSEIERLIDLSEKIEFSPSNSK